MPSNEQQSGEQPDPAEVAPSIDELPATISEYIENAAPDDLTLKADRNIPQSNDK